MGNTFGMALRVTTFGESHGGGLGAIVDGVPPNLRVDVADLQRALDRRRPGATDLGTRRDEPDRVEVLSGLSDGRTLGTPIALLVRNADGRSGDYEPIRHLYRPSHADFTTQARYGTPRQPGGGRLSARETVARVAAGEVARAVLASFAPIEIVAWVQSLHDLDAMVDAATVTAVDVDASPVRCPDTAVSAAMAERIRRVRAEGDTVGGVIRCVARGVPAGLGDPVFDKLEADLGRALLSIPAAKAFASGAGFALTRMLGSEANDPFVPGPGGTIVTATNRSGGIQGGISNGMPVDVTVAFKPVATLAKVQQTVDDTGRAAEIRGRGRHDPCVLPRAVPIVEAMVALVLADHLLRWRGQVGAPPSIPGR